MEPAVGTLLQKKGEIMRLIASVAALAFSLSSHSATIYLCQAYAGGTFWSNALCSTQKALIERTANVPDGMPFNQQVDMAVQQMNNANQITAQQITPSNSNEAICIQLGRERRALDEITEKMIWVPIETQNKNYFRMRQIKADMARLGCRY